MGVEEFVLALVTEQSTIKGATSRTTHAKNLSAAIFFKKVIKKLVDVPDDQSSVFYPGQVARLRRELEHMRSPETGLGAFDPSLDASKMPISTLSARIQKQPLNFQGCYLV